MQFRRRAAASGCCANPRCETVVAAATADAFRDVPRRRRGSRGRNSLPRIPASRKGGRRRSSEEIPSPTMRAPEPDGGRGLDPPAGSAAHRRRVWDSPSVSSTRCVRRPRTSSAERDEPREPTGHRGLRHRWVRALRELAERQRRVAETQLGGLLERRREALERTRVAQRPHGLELRLGGATLPDEVRVVGVRHAGSRRRAGRRRAPAPRARARCRTPRRRTGSPRSPPSSSRRRPSAARGR